MHIIHTAKNKILYLFYLIKDYFYYYKKQGGCSLSIYYKRKLCLKITLKNIDLIHNMNYNIKHKNTYYKIDFIKYKYKQFNDINFNY